MDPAAVKTMDREVVDEVEDAYTFADEAPDPAPEELYTDVYADNRRSSVVSRQTAPSDD
jgi:pyruvate dehydrogenase E1 component alpha subunit